MYQPTNTNDMEGYSNTRILGFGKHKGKAIYQIMHEEPDYLEWCVLHLNHFFLHDLHSLYAVNSHFQFSEDAVEENHRKAIRWQDWVFDEYDREREDYYAHQDRYTFEALTDGMCGDYADWIEGGGDIDHLKDSLGF